MNNYAANVATHIFAPRALCLCQRLKKRQNSTDIIFLASAQRHLFVQTGSYVTTGPITAYNQQLKR